MARHPVVFRGRPHQSGFAKQANKHKHTNAKTNRGRPQQFGFSTRTNQVIQSHLLIKSNEMKLWTDGEHDRGDSPVHARQVRNQQRGRAQPDQAGRQGGQAQVCSWSREIISRHHA